MRGTVTSGENRGASFVPLVEHVVVDELGFAPYPGTFNLADTTGLDALPVRTVEDPTFGTDDCLGMTLHPCSVEGVRAAVVRPIVDAYPADKVELVSPVRLRSVFEIRDGDTVVVAQSDDLADTSDVRVAASALDEFDAVLFDLDRTLVELAIDWDDVRTELESLLGASLAEPITEEMDADLRAVARQHGQWEAYRLLLREFEVDGAERATPLPLLEHLSDLECPVGVCTRNAVDAAERALERFDVRAAVDVLAGRETTTEGKPHPEPLRHCLRHLDVRPGDAVFVGDDATDRRAANAAGTSYFHPRRFDVGRR